MKFVHKLHEPGLPPWKRWFLSHSPSLGGHSYLERLICAKLPRYQSITTVRVGNGEMTSFWHDHWLLSDDLASAFPSLFSHCLHPELTVAGFCSSDLVTLFRPRLSAAADAERRMLLDCLASFQLQGSHESRRLAMAPGEVFTSSGAYRALHPPGVLPTDSTFIWNIRLPNKVKFFGWLLHHGRLNTRAHLLRRNLCSPEDSTCELCPDLLETDTHIFLECSRARQIWHRLDHVPLTGQLRMPWVLGSGLLLPEQTRPDIMLLLWHIWKARNATIFDHTNMTPSDVLRRIIHDLDIWSCRYGRLSPDLDLWKNWMRSKF